MPHAYANPFLHQNKPSRESIFCGRVGGWWITKAFIMLKFLLKKRQMLTGGWVGNMVNLTS